MLKVHGHRGCRAYLPENSLPSFFKAAALGCHALEMDVVVTKDKKVLVSHEPWLNSEICLSPTGALLSPQEGQGYNFYEMTCAQIQQLDCGSLGHPRFPEQQSMRCYKPTLSEVLTKVDAYCQMQGLLPVDFTIEIKRLPEADGIWHPPVEEFVDLVLEVLEEKGVLGRTLLQSFDATCLNISRRLVPNLAISYLTDNPKSIQDNFTLLEFVPSTYGPNFKYITHQMMEEAQQLGVAVVPWTVNEEEDMIRLIQLGVAGLISDYPKRVLNLIQKARQPQLTKRDLPDNYF